MSLVDRFPCGELIFSGTIFFGKKNSPRGDSNPQPPDPKSDALSIAPLRLSMKDGGVAQMVERTLSMREAQGSIPCSSTFFFCSFAAVQKYSLLAGLNRRPFAYKANALPLS